MIPRINDDLIQDIEIEEMPTYTHRLNIDSNNIMGFTDGLDAMKQAIYLILNIERYEHIIYSWNYGFEVADLFGKPTDYVLPELIRRITEALTQDERIISVDAFSFDVAKGKVQTNFAVNTIFGEIEAEKVVSI